MSPGELAAFYQDRLLGDCLPFWFPRCLDADHGGYLHCRDRDGTLIDSDKSIWAQGRMSWLLLELFNTVEQRSEWLAWGEAGLRFLRQFGFSADGRMFFHVTREGAPIRQRRYAYSEAFAAIACAAHARAAGSVESAAQANALFRAFTAWNFTPGMMPAKYTDVRPTIGMGPRMIALVTAQELRANLGTQPMYTAWIDRAIQEIVTFFVKPELECVMESVSPEGEIVDHFDGRLLNPGHAIEGAWFILEEGRLRQSPELIRVGCQMLDWMWQRGWDAEYGGLFYFRDVYQRPVQEYWHAMKFWWPHDEALIATLLAWQLTGETRYAQWHEQLRVWSFAHFADPEHGEWYGYLHQNGSPSSTIKGNMWKSCFHHPRALLKCWRIASELDSDGRESKTIRPPAAVSAGTLWTDQ